MSKVCILMDDADFEYHEIKGVFANYDLAEDAAYKLMGADDHNIDDLIIHLYVGVTSFSWPEGENSCYIREYEVHE